MKVIRQLAFWGVLAGCLVCPGCACRDREALREALLTPAQTDGRARLDVVDGVPVLRLYGTGDEMAHQYGTLLKPALQPFVGYVDTIITPGLQRCFFARAHAAEPHLPADILRQIRIAAEAANVPYDYLLAVNVVPQIECSALAVWGDKTTDGACVMGRNAEYISMGLGDCGSLLIVRHATDQTPMVLVSFVGMLGGFTGITADGVGFGNLVIFNARPEANEIRPKGLPVQLAMPLAADGAKTAAEMIDRLLAMNHAIPMNVMAADRTDSLIVELGPEQNVIRRGRDGVLSVSNYYVEHPNRWFSYDCPRQVAMEEYAEDHRGQMTAKMMEEALKEGSYDLLNLQAVVLAPATMRIHVSINKIPAVDGPYQVFDVEELLAD